MTGIQFAASTDRPAGYRCVHLWEKSRLGDVALRYQAHPPSRFSAPIQSKFLLHGNGKCAV